MHYDSALKGCGIYDERPDICRVDRQYTMNYASQFSWEKFVEVNMQVCVALQAKEEQAALQRIQALSI